MNIDFEDEMIVPKKVIPIYPVFKDISIIINHFVKDGVLIKRVEAHGKEAVVYHGYSNEIAKPKKSWPWPNFSCCWKAGYRRRNTYKPFHPKNAFPPHAVSFFCPIEVLGQQIKTKWYRALFVTFTPKTPEDYLCLIGVDSIDFYALKDGMFSFLALPFKISHAHPSNFGLILERTSFLGEFGNSPGVTQLFSLTHPYNEILPILCKFKGDNQCHYTFRDRRIGMVSKDIGANWNADYSGHIDLMMCYDYDERINQIFMIRKCTKEERLVAKSDLGMLSSSALMYTPSTVQSFYSPNFFNRRFAETRLAKIGLMNTQNKNQSPLFNSLLFAHSNPRQQQTNNSITSIAANIANSSAGSFVPHSRVTPITRRITRSMVAADKMAFSNPVSGVSSLPSSAVASEKSPSFHRSLEHNATINRMRLKQKLAMAESGSNIFHTPRHCASFSVDLDDLLSFGGKEEDDEPPSSLDMAVEFCLEWIWSESIPMEESARSGSSSSVGTDKVANKLGTLRVSSSTSSQSDDAANKTDVNRIASAFFISKLAFSQSERCIIFHIPTDRRIRVLSMRFLKTLENANMPSITENTPTFIRGNAAIPFLHAPFFMVLDNFSFSESLSTASSIFLYTGSQRVASIALNIGLVSVLRLLPAGLCADSRNLFEIRAFVEREGDFESEAFPQEANVLSSQLQLGFSTKLAHRCLRAICASLGSDRQLQFLSRLFCSNTWRIVAAASQIPLINEVPIECVEMALLFEQIYSEWGFDTAEVPFSQLLTRIRSKMNEEENEDDGCSATKRTRLDLRPMNLLEDDQYWKLFKSDHQMVMECVQKFDNLRELKLGDDRLMEAIRKCIREERRNKQPLNISDEKSKSKNTMTTTTTNIQDWITASVWITDLRVQNIQQMLDSSQPILIPSKALWPSFNEVQQREQHEQFLLTVALRTVTRPFGRAALNFHEEIEKWVSHGVGHVRMHDDNGWSYLEFYPEDPSLPMEKFRITHDIDFTLQMVDKAIIWEEGKYTLSLCFMYAEAAADFMHYLEQHHKLAKDKHEIREAKRNGTIKGPEERGKDPKVREPVRVAEDYELDYPADFNPIIAEAATDYAADKQRQIDLNNDAYDRPGPSHRSAHVSHGEEQGSSSVAKSVVDKWPRYYDGDYSDDDMYDDSAPVLKAGGSNPDLSHLTLTDNWDVDEEYFNGTTWKDEFSSEEEDDPEKYIPEKLPGFIYCWSCDKNLYPSELGLRAHHTKTKCCNRDFHRSCVKTRNKHGYRGDWKAKITCPACLCELPICHSIGRIIWMKF